MRQWIVSSRYGLVQATGIHTWGQDYKEITQTRLESNLKLTVLNNMKLRHFWAQIVSWAPRHARKTFIVLAPGISGQLPLLPPGPSPCTQWHASRVPGGVHFRAIRENLLLLMRRTYPSHLHLTRFTSLTMLMLVHLAISTLVTLLPAYLKNTSYGSSELSSFSKEYRVRGGRRSMAAVRFLKCWLWCTAFSYWVVKNQKFLSTLLGAREGVTKNVLCVRFW